MPRSPTLASSQVGADYVRGFEQIFQMLREGVSWSGHERGCCFLNSGTQTFANISSVSGLDLPDDARGMALVDWDHDGDLDVWTTNRNAPRTRFLRNGQRGGGHFLALKLEGSRCNRDGIGARAVLRLHDGRRLIRTVRAGDGFLSQSSKWLHFGLGDADRIDRLHVAWPDRTVETFDDLQVDRRYLIPQGGSAGALRLREESPTLPPSTPEPEPTAGRSRIVVTGRPLLPELRYDLPDGRQARLDEPRQRVVVANLWASWCPPCREELREWSRAAERFRNAGIDVVLLNVDDVAGQRADDAGETPPRFAESFTHARATQSMLATLEIVGHSVIDRELELALPSSFLIGADGRLTVIYRGEVSPDTLLADAALCQGSLKELRDAATPLTGRWSREAAPPVYDGIASRLVMTGRTYMASRYLDRLIEAEDAEGGGARRRKINLLVQRAELLSSTGRSGQATHAYREVLRLDENHRDAHLRLGYQLLSDGNRGDALEHLSQALRLGAADPDLMADLATLEHSRGRDEQAIDYWNTALKLRPAWPRVANNLAWVLATSDQSELRDPPRAVELAEAVCAETENKQPAYLDTLGAVYAAAGRFSDAIATAQRAIEIATAHGDEQTVKTMQERMRQFRAAQPVSSDAPIDRNQRRAAPPNRADAQPPDNDET